MQPPPDGFAAEPANFEKKFSHVREAFGMSAFFCNERNQAGPALHACLAAALPRGLASGSRNSFTAASSPKFAVTANLSRRW
jgi:hypothetical protein